MRYFDTHWLKGGVAHELSDVPNAANLMDAWMPTVRSILNRAKVSIRFREPY